MKITFYASHKMPQLLSDFSWGTDERLLRNKRHWWQGKDIGWTKPLVSSDNYWVPLPLGTNTVPTSLQYNEYVGGCEAPEATLDPGDAQTLLHVACTGFSV